MSTKTLSILALALACAFGGASIHAEELSKSGKPLTAQQLRMKNCNAEAKSNALKGDERKAFMSTCLKGSQAAAPIAAAEADDAAAAPAVAKAPTPRQLQRKACGEEAKAEGLKGEPRKEYVKECMKRPTPEAVS
jgi:hypothetical protein